MQNKKFKLGDFVRDNLYDDTDYLIIGIHGYADSDGVMVINNRTNDSSGYYINWFNIGSIHSVQVSQERALFFKNTLEVVMLNEHDRYFDNLTYIELLAHLNEYAK